MCHGMWKINTEAALDIFEMCNFRGGVAQFATLFVKYDIGEHGLFLKTTNNQ